MTTPTAAAAAPGGGTAVEETRSPESSSTSAITLAAQRIFDFTSPLVIFFIRDPELAYASQKLHHGSDGDRSPGIPANVVQPFIEGIVQKMERELHEADAAHIVGSSLPGVSVPLAFAKASELYHHGTAALNILLLLVEKKASSGRIRRAAQMAKEWRDDLLRTGATEANYLIFLVHPDLLDLSAGGSEGQSAAVALQQQQHGSDDNSGAQKAIFHAASTLFGKFSTVHRSPVDEALEVIQEYTDEFRKNKLPPHCVHIFQSAGNIYRGKILDALKDSYEERCAQLKAIRHQCHSARTAPGWSLQEYWRKGFDLALHHLQFGAMHEAISCFSSMFTEYYNHSDDFGFVSDWSFLRDVGQSKNLLDPQRGRAARSSGIPRRCLADDAEVVDSLLFITGAEMTCSLLLGNRAGALARFNALLDVIKEKFEESNAAASASPPGTAAGAATASCCPPLVVTPSTPTTATREDGSDRFLATQPPRSAPATCPPLYLQHFFLFRCCMSALDLTTGNHLAARVGSLIQQQSGGPFAAVEAQRSQQNAQPQILGLGGEPMDEGRSIESASRASSPSKQAGHIVNMVSAVTAEVSGGSAPIDGEGDASDTDSKSTSSESTAGASCTSTTASIGGESALFSSAHPSTSTLAEKEFERYCVAVGELCLQARNQLVALAGHCGYRHPVSRKLPSERRSGGGGSNSSNSGAAAPISVSSLLAVLRESEGHASLPAEHPQLAGQPGSPAHHPSGLTDLRRWLGLESLVDTTHFDHTFLGITRIAAAAFRSGKRLKQHHALKCDEAATLVHSSRVADAKKAVELLQGAIIPYYSSCGWVMLVRHAESLFVRAALVILAHQHRHNSKYHHQAAAHSRTRSLLEFSLEYSLRLCMYATDFDEHRGWCSAFLALQQFAAAEKEDADDEANGDGEQDDAKPTVAPAIQLFGSASSTSRGATFTMPLDRVLGYPARRDETFLCDPRGSLRASWRRSLTHSGETKLVATVGAAVPIAQSQRPSFDGGSSVIVAFVKRLSRAKIHRGLQRHSEGLSRKRSVSSLPLSNASGAGQLGLSACASSGVYGDDRSGSLAGSRSASLTLSSPLTRNASVRGGGQGVTKRSSMVSIAAAEGRGAVSGYRKVPLPRPRWLGLSSPPKALVDETITLVVLISSPSDIVTALEEERMRGAKNGSDKGAVDDEPNAAPRTSGLWSTCTITLHSKRNWSSPSEPVHVVEQTRVAVEYDHVLQCLIGFVPFTPCHAGMYRLHQLLLHLGDVSLQHIPATNDDGAAISVAPPYAGGPGSAPPDASSHRIAIPLSLDDDAGVLLVVPEPDVGVDLSFVEPVDRHCYGDKTDFLKVHVTIREPQKPAPAAPSTELVEDNQASSAVAFPPRNSEHQLGGTAASFAPAQHPPKSTCFFEQLETPGGISSGGAAGAITSAAMHAADPLFPHTSSYGSPMAPPVHLTPCRGEFAAVGAGAASASFRADAPTWLLFGHLFVGRPPRRERSRHVAARRSSRVPPPYRGTIALPNTSSSTAAAVTEGASLFVPPHLASDNEPLVSSTQFNSSFTRLDMSLRGGSESGTLQNFVAFDTTVRDLAEAQQGARQLERSPDFLKKATSLLSSSAAQGPASWAATGDASLAGLFLPLWALGSPERCTIVTHESKVSEVGSSGGGDAGAGKSQPPRVTLRQAITPEDSLKNPTALRTECIRRTSATLVANRYDEKAAECRTQTVVAVVNGHSELRLTSDVSIYERTGYTAVRLQVRARGDDTEDCDQSAAADEQRPSRGLYANGGVCSGAQVTCAAPLFPVFLKAEHLPVTFSFPRPRSEASIRHEKVSLPFAEAFHVSYTATPFQDRFFVTATVTNQLKASPLWIRHAVLEVHGAEVTEVAPGYEVHRAAAVHLALSRSPLAPEDSFDFVFELRVAPFYHASKEEVRHAVRLCIAYSHWSSFSDAAAEQQWAGLSPWLRPHSSTVGEGSERQSSDVALPLTMDSIEALHHATGCNVYFAKAGHFSSRHLSCFNVIVLLENHMDDLHALEENDDVHSDEADSVLGDAGVGGAVGHGRPRVVGEPLTPDDTGTTTTPHAASPTHWGSPLRPSVSQRSATMEGGWGSRSATGLLDHQHSTAADGVASKLFDVGEPVHFRVVLHPQPNNWPRDCPLEEQMFCVALVASDSDWLVIGRQRQVRVIPAASGEEHLFFSAIPVSRKSAIPLPSVSIARVLVDQDGSHRNAWSSPATVGGSLYLSEPMAVDTVHCRASLRLKRPVVATKAGTGPVG